MVKNPPANAGDLRDVGSMGFLGLERSLGRRHGSLHSGILAWRIPWTKEPWGLWSIGLHRVGHD